MIVDVSTRHGKVYQSWRDILDIHQDVPHQSQNDNLLVRVYWFGKEFPQPGRIENRVPGTNPVRTTSCTAAGAAHEARTRLPEALPISLNPIRFTAKPTITEAEDKGESDRVVCVWATRCYPPPSCHTPQRSLTPTSGMCSSSPRFRIPHTTDP